MKTLVKYLKILSVIAFSTIVSCGGSDDMTIEEEMIPIVVNFTLEVSQSNPFEITVDNISSGVRGLNSYWQFTTNGERVPDGSGTVTHIYQESGDYTVTLTVEGPNGDVSDSKQVTIAGVDNQSEALKDVASMFSMGMAVKSNRLTGNHNVVLTREFNSITAEFEMKMDQIYKTEGSFDFTAADAIVDYAQANNMDVHGHTLVWHNSIPSWMNSFSGTNEAFETLVKDYITAVMQRYAGKVRSWDVVNEAIEDNTNVLRNSIFRMRMGEDYIAKCYQYARDADPNALLFYNDYNVTFDTGKQAAMFAIVDDLLSKNLIDGVGAQMHISFNFPRRAQIQSVVDGTVSRGLKMHFAELDIRVNPNNDITFLTDQRAIAQQNKAREVAEIYNAIPDANKFALTLWGMRDSESWLPDFWGQPDWGLFYNEDFLPKRAHAGLLEGMQ
jgi:endo-1,4-beta-xylanase